MPCTAEVLLTPCYELLCYCWDHGLYCCGTIGTMPWSAAQYSWGTIDEWDYGLSCYGTINTMICVLWYYWRHAMYIDDTKPYTAVILWRPRAVRMRYFWHYVIYICGTIDTMRGIPVVLLTQCDVYLWYYWHHAIHKCATIDTVSCIHVILLIIMPCIPVILLTPCHVYLWY